MNQMRSILLERGITVPQAVRKLRDALADVLATEVPVVSARMGRLREDMAEQWHRLDECIASLGEKFAGMAHNDPAARRLATIPGIGVLNATALVAAVDSRETFGRGRVLAAWLGLVLRQATTGGRPKLLGITKRGSKYLPKLLIQ